MGEQYLVMDSHYRGKKIICVMQNRFGNIVTSADV